MMDQSARKNGELSSKSGMMKTRRRTHRNRISSINEFPNGEEPTQISETPVRIASHLVLDGNPDPFIPYYFQQLS